jgi:hypothetical protein
MTKEPWFRARTGRFSWGWTPVTWQGWLVTLGLALLIVGFSVVTVVIAALRR